MVAYGWHVWLLSIMSTMVIVDLKSCCFRALRTYLGTLYRIIAFLFYTAHPELLNIENAEVLCASPLYANGRRGRYRPGGIFEEGREGGGGVNSIFMHGRSRMAIDPRGGRGGGAARRARCVGFKLPE